MDGKVTKTVQRNTSADLLRILLIIFMISHHALVHGIGLSNLKYGNSPPIEFSEIVYFLLNGICIIAVNSFFFVSGFFGIKRNIKKLVLMYVECCFYMCIWQVIGVLFLGKEIEVFYLLIPIKDYWFMAVYFVIAILAPYLAVVNNYFNNKDRWMLLIVLSLINVLYGFLFELGEIGDG